MQKEIINQIKIAFILLIIFTILTGLIYPAIVTVISQFFFPWQANGSLIQQNGKIVGSKLIGQSFNSLPYFWSRPSATSPYPYNAENSSGSNLGPSNPDFLASIKTRANRLRQYYVDPEYELVPVGLVTASASGLDPEISPLAAYYQIPRIAKARKIPAEKIQTLIQNLTQVRTFDILGEARINVLELNLALDQLKK